MIAEIRSRLEVVRETQIAMIEHPLDRASLDVDRKTIEDRCGFGIRDRGRPPSSDRLVRRLLLDEHRPAALPDGSTEIEISMRSRTRTEPLGAGLDRRSDRIVGGRGRLGGSSGWGDGQDEARES